MKHFVVLIVSLALGAFASTAFAANGANVIGPTFVAYSVNSWAGYSTLTVIPGPAVNKTVNTVKLKFSFTGGTKAVIGNMVMLQTAFNSGTVTKTVPITIKGVSNPTIHIPSSASQNSPFFVTTDTLNATLDKKHNQWVVVYFTTDSTNNSLFVGGMESSSPVCGFYLQGDQTGITSIPAGWCSTGWLLEQVFN